MPGTFGWGGLCGCMWFNSVFRLASVRCCAVLACTSAYLLAQLNVGQAYPSWQSLCSLVPLALSALSVQHTVAHHKGHVQLAGPH